jgi:hypothetical protein
VLHSLTDLSITQFEGGRFKNLISSLIDPFVHASNVLLRAEEDPVVASRLESLDLIWDFRVALLTFIVGMVSAPEDLSERIALRSELEARGLLTVFGAFRSWGHCPRKVLDNIDLFEDEKDDDREAMEDELKDSRTSVK